jgi:hypothetical protein
MFPLMWDTSRPGEQGKARDPAEGLALDGKASPRRAPLAGLLVVLRKTKSSRSGASRALRQTDVTDPADRQAFLQRAHSVQVPRRVIAGSPCRRAPGV